MEISVKYIGLRDRAEKIEECEAQKKSRDFDIFGIVRDTKLRMLHDNFDDPNWKHGDPIVGTMIFTDEPSPVVEMPPVRDLTAEEIDRIKADIQDIKARLGIVL